MFDSISLKFGKDFSELIYVLIVDVTRDPSGDLTGPASIIKYSLKVSDELSNGDTKLTMILRLPSATSLLNSIFSQPDGYCILNLYTKLLYVKKFFELIGSPTAY
jgi:hypothetical protein